MPEFNIDRIRQIAGEIKSALLKLEKIREIKREDFLASSEKIDSAKYNLIVVIEGVVDICNHIVAKLGGRSPCDYSDCFTILEELGIFDSEFVERLKKMVRFRNLLVHLYWRVDNEKVYEVIKVNLGDIEEYLQGIGKVIKEAI